MHKVIFSPEAEKDLNDIYDFIADQDSVYGYKVIDAIFFATRQLSYFPKIGVTISDMDHRMIVDTIFGYKITYKIEDSLVIIVTVSKYRE